MDSNNDNNAPDAGTPASSDQPPAQGTRPTRVISVSIQYAFVNGLRLGAGGEHEEQGATDGAGMPPIGDFVLNFTDVPESTTRERIDEVVALASGVAVNRMSRSLNRSRGISRKAFELLPVLKTEQSLEDSCSICYDGFVEEEPEVPSTAEQSRKRVRDGEAGHHGCKHPKRTRYEQDESEVDDQNGPANDGETASSPPEQEQPKDNENSGDDQGKVTYKHSPVQLPCSHVFGRECIRQWTNLHNTCPICRANIVGADGLNNNFAMDDLEDQASLERIRRLLYDTAPSPAPQPESNDSNSGVGDTNTPTAESTEAGTSSQPTPSLPTPPPFNTGAFHNFILLRPHRQPAPETQGAGQTNTTTPRSGATPPLAPLFPGQDALGVFPITYINLRRNASGQQSTSGGSEEPQSASTGDNSNTNNDDSTNPGPDNDRLMSILDHIFSISNGNRARSQPTARSNAEPQNGTSTGTAESPSETQSTTNSSTPIRSHIFNNLFRFARNLRNTDGNREPHPLSTVSNMFSTGVASYRSPDGVSTVDFNGDIPSPAPQNRNQREQGEQGEQGENSSSGETGQQERGSTEDSNTPNAPPS